LRYLNCEPLVLNTSTMSQYHQIHTPGTTVVRGRGPRIQDRHQVQRLLAA
jgi:hypothetical protein